MAEQSYNIDALIQASESKKKARKYLKLLVFRAKRDVPVPSLEAGVFDPEDRTKIKIDLKVWEPVGMITKEGTSRDTKVKVEGMDSYNNPGEGDVREDITGVERTFSFTMAEDLTRIVLETRYGRDLSALTVNQTNGIAFDEPNIPLTPYYRYLVISRDYWESDISLPIYEVSCYLRVKQDELPKEEHKAGSAVETTFSGKVTTDEEYGTPVRHWVDGAGFDGTKHGFKPLATTPA